MRIKCLFLSLTGCLLVSIQCFTAGPVTHVFLAERWMENVIDLENEERTAFLLGNLFPDIRYIANIPRTDTHEKDLTLDDVYLSPNQFVSGTRLHAFVDEMREALVLQWQIYPYVQDFGDGHTASLLKFVEDELLYERIDFFTTVDSLDTIIEAEIDTGIAEETLKKWHWFLGYYLSVRPTLLLEILAIYNMPCGNIPPDTVKLWSQVVPILAEQPELIAYVENLTLAFTETFQHFAKAPNLITTEPTEITENIERKRVN